VANWFCHLCLSHRWCMVSRFWCGLLIQQDHRHIGGACGLALDARLPALIFGSSDPCELDSTANPSAYIVPPPPSNSSGRSPSCIRSSSDCSSMIGVKLLKSRTNIADVISYESQQTVWKFDCLGANPLQETHQAHQSGRGHPGTREFQLVVKAAAMCAPAGDPISFEPGGFAHSPPL